MHPPDHIVQLLDKYLAGKATAAERAAVDAWHRSSLPEGEIEVPGDEHEIEARMQKRLAVSLQQHQYARRWKKAASLKAAAAVLILLLGAGIYVLRSGEKSKADTADEPSRPAAPLAGTGKALLTLADGSTIELDAAADGLLAERDGVKVMKLNGAQLQYNSNKGSGAEVMRYNYISTPPGSQYQITLADQTRVWLNASSTIRFPTAFRGTVREVEITGEAYFEVAHDPAKTFQVKVNNGYIRVFGTRFNVMAYDNENSILTTLLEGSLGVENDRLSERLTPGQQARLHKDGSIAVATDINLSEVLAWKNGKFLFNSLDIAAIMRQLERWYDIKVSYESRPAIHFTGQLDRNLEVSQILRKLELTREVQFRIEGKKIIVQAPAK